MNIANELRKLADQIDKNYLNINEENSKKELYEEFIERLKIIKDHIERKRSQAQNLDQEFIKNFINDYELKITRLL